MHPYTETDIITHIRDEFDGTYPWRGYWCLRLGDANFPGNLSSDFYYGYPMPPKADNPAGEWQITADGLVFPVYDWLLGGSGLGQELFFKIKTTQPPFRFELGLKWTTNIDRVSPATTHTVQINAPYLGQIAYGGSALRYFVQFSHIGNLNGFTAFDNNTYTQGTAMRYYFQVGGDLIAKWGLQETLTTPANTTTTGEWLPDTNKVTTIDWVNEMNSFYPRYLPVRIRSNFGGTLRYLEARIFNHEA